MGGPGSGRRKGGAGSIKKVTVKGKVIGGILVGGAKKKSKLKLKKVTVKGKVIGGILGYKPYGGKPAKKKVIKVASRYHPSRKG